MAVQADKNVITTEEEKVERYQDLAFEIRRIYGASKVTVKPWSSVIMIYCSILLKNVSLVPKSAQYTVRCSIHNELPNVFGEKFVVFVCTLSEGNFVPVEPCFELVFNHADIYFGT